MATSFRAGYRRSSDERFRFRLPSTPNLDDQSEKPTDEIAGADSRNPNVPSGQRVVQCGRNEAGRIFRHRLFECPLPSSSRRSRDVGVSCCIGLVSQKKDTESICAMSLDLNLPIASQDLCGPGAGIRQTKNALVDYAKADLKAPMAISAAIARVTNVVVIMHHSLAARGHQCSTHRLRRSDCHQRGFYRRKEI